MWILVYQLSYTGSLCFFVNQFNFSFSALSHWAAVKLSLSENLSLPDAELSAGSGDTWSDIQASGHLQPSLLLPELSLDPGCVAPSALADLNHSYNLLKTTVSLLQLPTTPPNLCLPAPTHARKLCRAPLPLGSLASSLGTGMRREADPSALKIHKPSCSLSALGTLYVFWKSIRSCVFSRLSLSSNDIPPFSCKT